MANEDKAGHKAEELKGRAKEKLGDVTDTEQLQAEGKAEQAKGSLKQAGEKLKDTVTGMKKDKE
ncbi:CsbD family protein [Saccharopolyspora erythraea]|uniref:CsbD family protein n=1 Tax=Saccharopolyspora erythraea TaxID=1836 RepID=UPI001BA5E989|nr:CsbD family protein [Saccharopolyspora erythraea]QUH00643.1 CsbD family protein [Saccharopolyspora erythraea]